MGYTSVLGFGEMAHLAGSGHGAPEGGTGEAVTEQSGGHFVCFEDKKLTDVQIIERIV